MSKRYYKGMKGVLDGTGAKIVLVAYSVLLKNVKSKLDDYIKKINKLEDDISRYYERIAAINAEITSLKAAEKTN
jgi:chaperonin cofactor prefoldin